MKKSHERLDEMMISAAQALGYEYLGCEIGGGAHGSLLRVYIDSIKGINIDDCEKMSRQLSAILDVEDPITGHYTLEVSSPGIERPLFTLEQYRRFIRHPLKLRLYELQGGRRNFTGILEQVTENSVILKVENELISFKYIDIDKAHLIETLPK